MPVPQDNNNNNNNNHNKNLHLRILDRPKKYKGYRDKLHPFLTQLRLKAAQCPDHQSQLQYTISLLEGWALVQVMPYIDNDPIGLDNLATLITILETAFGDPDKWRL